MGNPIKVGEQAPDFELKDHTEKTFKLSDVKGKKILLS
jgi:peroxiredoxin